ncbi:MAG: hypothetical protein HY788_17025 [Deltaproteobacteria bacterium]|nr:hypothetical protein [Deltaproteobacteria bacterium]
MTYPMPEGELFRKAIRWISERRELPERPALSKLIEEAGKIFNLSPKDQEFLFDFLTRDRQ